MKIKYKKHDNLLGGTIYGTYRDSKTTVTITFALIVIIGVMIGLSI